MLIPAQPFWKGVGFPNDIGKALADHVLTHGRSLDDVVISLKGLPASLLIGGFFFGFLQRIYDKDPDRLGEARLIIWSADFDFQEEFASDCMKEFTPN